MKNKYFKLIFFFILLLFWLIFSLDFSLINMIIGSIVSFFVVISSKGVIYNEKGFIYNIPKLSTLLIHIFKVLIYMYISGFKLLYTIIKGRAEPIIFSFDLDSKNQLIATIVANSITLTPGTVTLDQQKNRLLILAIKNNDNFGKDISDEIKKNFERPLLRE